MSSSINTYNGLNGEVLTREEITSLLKKAEAEGQTHILNNLKTLLSSYPDAKRFDIELSNPQEEILQENLLPGIDYMAIPEEGETPGLGKPVSPDDIYQMITDVMINTIKIAGELPWQNMWEKSSLSEGLTATNFESKKAYRGINFFLLNFDTKVDEDGNPYMGWKNWENPYFLTFKQIEKNKGKLVKGSKGHKVVYFTKLFSVDEEGKNGKQMNFGTYNKKKFDAWIDKNSSNLKKHPDLYKKSYLPILKYYNVFNGGDVRGVDFGEMPVNENAQKNEEQKIQVAEAIVKAYPNAPSVKMVGDQPAYYPKDDQILMTPIGQFANPQFFYSVFFHELTHSTGHSKRLDRGNDTRARSGSKEDKAAYDFEELVAEMGSVFLCSESGILFKTRDQSAIYLKHYLNKLMARMKEDNRFFFRAASRSQAAADHILDRDKEGVPAYLKQLESKPTKPQFEEPKDVKQAISNVKKIAGWYLKEKSEFETIISEAKNIKPSTSVEDLDFLIYELKKAQLEEIAQEIDWVVTFKKNDNASAEVKKDIKTNVKSFKVSDIKTDEKRFQNRAKLNNEVVKNIVENFKETDFDPLVIWLDKKDDKYYLLAGHHRFAALKKLGKKTAPVKIANKDYPSEKEAIRYAKELSNANRTLEQPYERAEIYRRKRQDGESKVKIAKAAEIEGKNKNYVLNLSYLSEKGKSIQALKQFSGSSSKQDKNEIEKIADWIGQAKRNYSDLTDAHETEMFNFLNNKNESKRITSKVSFLQKINSVVGAFDFSAENSLNLKRFKYESQGEKVYNTEVLEKKEEINELQEKIDAIKLRFTDVGAKNYVNPSKKDYEDVKDLADSKVANLNANIKKLQTKLQDLYKNKGNYIKGGTEQIALLGPRKKATKKTKKKGLTGEETPTSETQHKHNTNPTQTQHKSNSLAARLKQSENTDSEFYKIDNPDVSKFLGKVEIKPKDSIGISITAPQGAGKTRFAFQLVDAFAANYNVGIASMEEHPESNLFLDKVREYITPKNIENVEAPEVTTMQDLHKLIEANDVIVIDSFEKLREIDKHVQVDKDLRKKYDGKLFVVIFQLTSDGKMRGGSKSQFDVDIVLFTEKFDDYRENYIYTDKNRYNHIPASDLKYNIYDRALMPIEGESGVSAEENSVTHHNASDLVITSLN